MISDPSGERLALLGLGQGPGGSPAFPPRRRLELCPATILAVLDHAQLGPGRHAADHDLVPASAGSEVRWLAEACDRLCELMEDSWCRVLVAEERGQIIAVLGLVLNRPDSRRSGIATICVLQVHPNHNRRGIGSRLVRFAEGIARILREYGVMVDLRVASAHKTPRRVEELARQYGNSLEPGAIIAVAGLSNGLGGALAANATIPVFNCPTFKDRDDLALNINSSLMLPSNTPAATVVRPDNVALAALRSLNLNRLRDRFQQEIEATKEKMAADDRFLRQE